MQNCGPAYRTAAVIAALISIKAHCPVRPIVPIRYDSLAGGGASEIGRMKQPAPTPDANEDSVSRRAFLTGAGATAGGVMLERSLSASKAFADEKPSPAIIG